MSEQEGGQKLNLVQQIHQLEQEYNNYIDSSEVIMEYYKNQQISGFDKHFLKIEEWLDEDKKENGPLIVEADDGVGKKTLLVKWINYHIQNRKSRYEDIIIPHFTMIGGNNSNYFYAIYRILIKLRELLNIGQKVELLEEKLRKYFAYWLDVCNSELEKQIINDNKTLYNRIILIFEGANHFLDANNPNKEANISFWLPKYFPPRIKVIVTVSKDSQALLYFQKIGANTIQIKSEISIIQQMLITHKNRKLFISDGLRDKLLNIFTKKQNTSAIFCKTVLSLLLPYPSVGVITEQEIRPDSIEEMISQIDFQKLQDINNLTEFINYILDFYSNKLMKQDKFIKLILSFAITQKGLTVQEIILISGVTETNWKEFVAIFKIYLMHFKQYWIINNDLFKTILVTKYCQNPDIITQLHEEIADHLNKTPNSIRKLEEQTYHLFMAKAHFKLKEIISTIENFLLLFNPNNKYDLCRYWQELEAQGFDPVIEYNKAIEGFFMQYHPTSEDLFRIIVQVSRFLKEFCDFETYFTPRFKHPPVQGIEEELDDIGLLNELFRMELCYIIDPMPKKTTTSDENYKSPQERIAEKIEKIKIKQNKKPRSDPTKIKVDKPKTNEEPTKIKPQILTKLEKLNVDIPYNREQVKKYFEDRIGIQTLEDPEAKTKDSDELLNLDASPTSQRELNFIDMEYKRLDRPPPLKLTHGKVSMKQLQEEQSRVERKPTDYYYKRWIWIQFPWACLSLQSDYSAKMKQCFAKATEYMSVQEEKAFTRQALKIAIEAKLKKKMMYQKQDENPNQASQRALHTEFSIISKKQDQNNSVISFLRSSTQLKLETQTSNQRLETLNMTKNTHFKTTRNQPQSLQFFLTEDQVSLAALHKEIEEQKQNNQQPNQQTEQKDQRLLPSLKSQDNLNTTQKIIDKSKIQKEKSKAYNPQQTLNSSTQSILPRLKGSIQLHNNKELNIMSHQAKLLKKELDNIVYQNQMQTKKLQQIKTIQHNEGCDGQDIDHVLQVSESIDVLLKSQEEAEYQYMISMVQDGRLRIIIKICSDNRSYHEEWIRDLNYYMSNLNKLIKFEKEDISRIEKQIKTIHLTHTQYVDAFNDNIHYSKKMITQINKTIKNKEELDTFFQQSDSIIEKKSTEKMKFLEQQYFQQEEKEQKQQKRVQLEKNSKSISDKLEILSDQMKKLCKYIDLSDQNYNEQHYFHNFLQQIDTKQQLQVKIVQQEDSCHDLNNKSIQLKRQLDTLKNANSNEQKLKRERTMLFTKGRVTDQETMQMIKEKREQLQLEISGKERQKTKIGLALLDYKISIRNIRNKLQSTKIKLIESQPNITILGDVQESLLKKQQLVREKLGEEKFNLFLKGKMDFNEMYKAAYKYYEDPLLKQMETY